MTFQNDGQGISNVLQNKFTAYLQRVLRRKRNEYIIARNLRLGFEYSLEDNDPRLSVYRELEADLSYEFQLEDEALHQALSVVLIHCIRTFNV